MKATGVTPNAGRSFFQKQQSPETTLSIIFSKIEPAMKKHFLFPALFLVFPLLLSAQDNFKAGLRAGVSTTDIQASDLVVYNSEGAESLRLGIQDANYGYHLGAFFQAKAGAFFIQPEVLFNSNNVDFKVRDNGENPQILRETYRHLDLPVMMGLKLGPVRLQAGPVGHYFLNSSSELIQIEQYTQNHDRLTLGYQAGIGLDIWKFVLDVKHEGNFNRFGEHITIAGEDFAFDRSPHRVVATLGFTF